MKTQRRNFLSKLSLSGLAISTLGINNLYAKSESQVQKGKKVLVHQVYFWLKKDLTDAQKATFDKGLKSLLQIKTIKYGDVGKPGATTPRPVIDSSYDYALLTVFEDVKAHDSYQIDPIHEQFVKDCKEMWEKVVVYDAQSA
jgi:hypothetical protein